MSQQTRRFSRPEDLSADSPDDHEHSNTVNRELDNIVKTSLAGVEIEEIGSPDDDVGQRMRGPSVERNVDRKLLKAQPIVETRTEDVNRESKPVGLSEYNKEKREADAEARRHENAERRLEEEDEALLADLDCIVDKNLSG